MGGISTGVGIFSGIDTRSLIDQLLQIEARPKQLAQRRLVQLQTQQAAFLDINSALLNLRTASAGFRSNNIFRASRATSSDSDVVTATAGLGATTGSFQLSIDRLVSTHQSISRGFADRDVAGVGAEAFTFEVGGGRLDSETSLASLNGSNGIERGKIKITDSQGGTAEIDLSRAVTIDDVIEAINSNSGLQVTASVSDTGYGLRIADNVGGTVSVSNVFGSQTATSLGIEGSASGAIVGSDILRLSEATSLSALNDGAGVSFLLETGPANLPDFRILVEDAGGGNGTTHDIKLGEFIETIDGEPTATKPAVTTLGGLFDRIEEDTGGAVTARINDDGTGIVLETSDAGKQLTVQAGTSRPTARDLGLLTAGTGQEVQSRKLLASINSTLASNLNGGSGVADGTVSFTSRDGGTVFQVDVSQDDSVSDIIRKINSGGGGVITAALNKTGNGLLITDSSTGGDLIIGDVSGTAAAELGIETAGESSGQVESGNLQSRYVSEATRLDSLRGGEGIGTGTIRITDSSGGTREFEITEDDVTVADLVQKINGFPQIEVTARVNDTGDGIIIEDDAEGAEALTIEDVEGRVARNLNLAGESSSAAVGENKIDGSFERRIEFEATDTLQEIVDKINASSVGVDAAVVNNGSGVNPFQLVFTSEQTGSVGRFIVETGQIDLGIKTLTKGEDAVAFFGASSAADGVLLRSTTNTFSNVVAGVTFEAQGTSQNPVEISVSRDTTAIEEAVVDFVDAFNNALDRIDAQDSFNSETETRGPLLGDQSVANIRSRLLRVIQGSPQGVDSQLSGLFEAGVSIGDGARLEFDRDRFRAALDDDLEAVRDLFAAFEQAPNEDEVLLADDDGAPLITTGSSGETFLRLGVAEQIKQLTDQLTNSLDGVLSNRSETLDSQIRLQERRITAFDQQLEVKRFRLEQQFLQMERAIAQLQTQQSALASLSG